VAGRALALLSFAALSLAAEAQVAGLLYDPEPPANSAYVRVINVAGDAPVDVSVDGRARITSLASGEASDYLVLPAGKRNLVIGVAGKGEAASTSLDVTAGHAITVAVRSGAAPWIFEDKANTNKLKAVIAVYHLGSGAPFDVLTADGATKVFTGVKPGTSAGLSVNPIKVDLIVATPGTNTPVARTSVAMAPGGTYSLLLLPGPRGALTARAFQNKVERYTGK